MTIANSPNNSYRPSNGFNVREKRNFNRVDWPLIALSIMSLLIYLIYSWTYIFATPYPGFEFTPTDQRNGLRIIRSNVEQLQVDDIIVAINELSVTDVMESADLLGFRGLIPGEPYSIELQGSGALIELAMPEVRFSDRFDRALGIATFLVFWLAGTAVYLFLQPRDSGWVLMVVFMYVIAMFLVLGGVSSWRILSSIDFLRLLTIMLAPITIHLHWVVPSNLAPTKGRYVIPLLYATAAVCIVLEFLSIQIPLVPPLLFSLGLIFTIVVLIYRYFSSATSAADQIAVRLMISGILLSLGPGIIFYIVPIIFGNSFGSSTSIQISQFATPILPLFYIYAIYKRQLGKLEFRTNRLLSAYSFILLYTPILLVIIWGGQSLIESPDTQALFLVFVTIIFIVSAPPLLRRSQSLLNRLAYGSQHNPDEIVRMFANQIPSTLKREALYDLLTTQITPALLIRQSVLYIFENQGLQLVYAEGLEKEVDRQIMPQLQTLLAQSGRYIPPSSKTDSSLNWIRLTIPLTLRNATVGVWLFGRRDPDDFYPQDDILLLETLANQLAPVIENIQLYEALQNQANTLSDRVQEQTVELRTERDRTQAILDNAGEGVFFTDPAGLLLYANQALATITGYETAVLLGQSLTTWSGPESNQIIHEFIEAALSNSESWNGELTIQNPNGGNVDISLTISPILDDLSEAAGFVGVVSDISQAKEIDRLKSNIISNVSHELKTPLTNIRLYLELLSKGREKRLPEYLNILGREADKLNRLIMDLLAASQIEMGTLPIDLVPTNVTELVADALRHCAPAAAKKSISLENSLSPDMPPALADATQLERVLTNLVVNAVNYTPNGSIVTITGGQDSGDTIWLSVTDNGSGIPENELPHLFERFFRGETGRDNKGSGTGLGLSICREIMELHEGSITVSSVQGEGATFTLNLQASQTEPNAELNETQ